jgi:hypothetical protein
MQLCVSFLSERPSRNPGHRRPACAIEVLYDGSARHFLHTAKAGIYWQGINNPVSLSGRVSHAMSYIFSIPAKAGIYWQGINNPGIRPFLPLHKRRLSRFLQKM